MVKNPFRETLLLESEIQRVCERRKEIGKKLDSTASRETKKQLLRKFLSLEEHLQSLFEVAKCKYLRHTRLGRAASL